MRPLVRAAAGRRSLTAATAAIELDAHAAGDLVGNEHIGHCQQRDATDQEHAAVKQGQAPTNRGLWMAQAPAETRVLAGGLWARRVTGLRSGQSPGVTVPTSDGRRGPRAPGTITIRSALIDKSHSGSSSGWGMLIVQGPPTRPRAPGADPKRLRMLQPG